MSTWIKQKCHKEYYQVMSEQEQELSENCDETIKKTLFSHQKTNSSWEKTLKSCSQAINS